MMKRQPRFFWCLVCVFVLAFLLAGSATAATLNVEIGGGGKIYISPPGVVCDQEHPKNCTQTYLKKTFVRLSALALPGAIYGPWGGACMGSTVDDCLLTLDILSNQRVTGSFPYTISLPTVIEGFVSDGISGSAILHANVSSEHGGTATSWYDGYYFVYQPLPGTITVTAEAQGYGPAFKHVTAVPGGTVRADFVLIPDCARTYYRDADRDVYGNPSVSALSCTPPPGYVLNSSDCDDSRKDIHPGAPETCDGLDQNCDGRVDEGLRQSFFRDADGDGFGDLFRVYQGCSPPADHVADGGDCNDGDPLEHPGQIWYRDGDGDGFSDGDVDLSSCRRPAGYRVFGELLQTWGDCNDGDVSVSFGTPGTCGFDALQGWALALQVRKPPEKPDGMELSFSSGPQLGVEGDWWVVADTPAGLYYLGLSPLSWVPWLPAMPPTYQGPLFDFSGALLPRPGEAGGGQGTCIVYFAVDTTMNGVVDEPLFLEVMTLDCGVSP